jgi:hypothetical protein
MIEKEEGRKDDSIERAYNLWCTGAETLYFALKRIVIFYRYLFLIYALGMKMGLI